MNRRQRLALFEQVDIYPVTCERLSRGRNNLEVLRAVIAGGARIIQLREKEYSKRRLYELGLQFREITAAAGVLLIINDHLDVALAVEADGVHLGQDDLPVAVARRLAPELIIGASTHGLEEALEAERDGADYYNIGPIFPTGTKEVERVLGPEAIEVISSRVGLPFTVMGGIDADNLKEVVSRGAKKVAMISAITAAEDITATVRRLRAIMRSAAG